ncbi:MAG: hypothetical protein MJ252_01420 [archaeon]|nr:hypothetical protein [archaeon]
MNTNDNLMPNNISSIITNFSNLVRNFSIKDTEWQMQKEDYEKRITELEGEVKAHENINIDLLKRIRMLEYALNLERQKNQGTNTQSNPEPPNENNMFNDLGPQNLIKEEDLQFLQEKSNRPSLLSMLQSIGIDDNLAKNLFEDFELNKTELDAMIKRNLDEKLNQIGMDTFQDAVNQAENKNKGLREFSFQASKDSNSLGNNDLNNALMNQQQNKTNEALEKNYKFSLNEFIELRSHFDEVRKLTYLKEINSLISVSEDCLIKVWSLNNIFYLSQNGDLEPYLTLRGHTGPLYCTEHGLPNSNLIYTGGNEGLIQIWTIPKQDEINQYGESENLFNMNVGFFQKKATGEQDEIIWDLKHHPSKNLLVSLSSDETINLWNTATVEEYVDAFSSVKYVDKWLSNSYKKKPEKGNINAPNECIPTVCEFLNSDNNKLIIGFNDAYVSMMDIEKGSFISSINTYNEKMTLNRNISKINYQPDCFACASALPLVYAGFEDNTIKVMDLRMKSDIITNVVNAHSDAVTSLNLFEDIYLFSISHDTTIKMWDLRKFIEPINTTVGSQKKWDEAMWDSLLIKDTLTLCVACADCTVKLYKL